MSAVNLEINKFIDNISTEVAKTFEKKMNPFSYPKIKYISITSGVGKLDNKAKDEVANYLEKLVGQKINKIKSKKAISGFKLRKGDIVGLRATLRGKKVYDFLLNLIYITLPRTRDFRGIKADSFDSNFKTYSLGIPSAAIFPAIGFDTQTDFGIQANIVFATAGENNKVLLEKLNFPFVK